MVFKGRSFSSRYQYYLDPYSKELLHCLIRTDTLHIRDGQLTSYRIIVPTLSNFFCQLLIIEIGNYWVIIVTIKEFLKVIITYRNIFGVFICFSSKVDNNRDDRGMNFYQHFVCWYIHLKVWKTFSQIQ